MTQSRTPVKIYLSVEERQILDQQAKELGVHRGEMIRERALSAPQQAAGLPRGPQVYADALEALHGLTAVFRESPWQALSAQ
jgi:hypothetical protein